MISHKFPIELILFFVLISLLCLFLVFRILKSSSSLGKYVFGICILLSFWLGIQALLSLIGVYRNYPNAVPPKIVLFGVFPMLLINILLFAIPKIRRHILTFSLIPLTQIHLIRIPVEFALYFLFLNKAIPEIMTFEGSNFDILSGITAPIVLYFYKKGMSPYLFICWHLICLGLLGNIVYTAIFSGIGPIQKYGFDQPNVAVLFFPFSWLPSFIVPAVLFSHVSSIMILLHRINNKAIDKMHF